MMPDRGLQKIEHAHGKWGAHASLCGSMDTLNDVSCRLPNQVGSKPELLLAMSMLAGRPGSLLVCNGYKDTQYIELVSTPVIAVEPKDPQLSM